MVPDLDLRRRAAAARDELRHAVCVYLELVALERAGDAGTVEALERAATVGDSPAFVRIRDALTRAELAGQPPWTGLAELADAVGVPELGDLADIMRLSGEDGAAVYATLRARAASLRTQLLAANAAAANAASRAHDRPRRAARHRVHGPDRLPRLRPHPVRLGTSPSTRSTPTTRPHHQRQGDPT